MHCWKGRKLGRIRNWVSSKYDNVKNQAPVDTNIVTHVLLSLCMLLILSEVTIIPTYDSDVLGYWVAENEEALMENRIDLAPSASRCTINLQDHETSCAAYRLEF